MDNICNCYQSGTCLGTKECDPCSCAGDRTKCDFYEEVKLKEKNKMQNTEMNIKSVAEYYEKYFAEREIKDFDTFAEVVDMRNRNIYLGEVAEDSGCAVESVIRLCNQYDEQRNIPIEKRLPIKIWINSCGGDLKAAFTACDAIEISSTPVITINQGTAYSAGALIFLTGHERIAFPRSSFLIHEGSIGSGQMDAHKFQEMSDFYHRERDMLKSIILDNTKISEKDYNAHIKDDWWLHVEEALELGIVDSIMTHEKYQELLA